MKIHRYSVLLSLVLWAVACIDAPGQTTIEQRLSVIQNDGINGGLYTIALEVKASNLTGRNTLGTATIDILYNGATLAYSSYTFPNTPSGISLQNGYSKPVTPQTNKIRVGVVPIAVDGIDVTGTDLTTSYVTWATITFSIVNAAASATITINDTTNQIALFDQEGNSNGSGGSGNGVLTDQTLSPPIVINDAALPVELVSFSAIADRFGTRLEWKTATETNNAGFEIERSDASVPSQARTWTDLGFVAGAGTSASEKYYTFRVGPAPQGKSVYRLKQIDRDGGAQYSQEVEAAAVIPKEFALLQNYPNPFNPSTTIGYTIPEDSRVSIVAYDLIGRQAAVLLNETKPAGMYTLAFDARALPSGVYIYRMTAQSSRNVFTEAKCFVLMR